MNELQRFELRLPADDRAGLDELAAKSGLNATSLIRVGVKRLLAESGLILGNGPVNEQRDFAAFISEMRADPAFAAGADDLADAFEKLDLQADGNEHAAKLILLLAIVARSIGPLGVRIALMDLLVHYRGPVQAVIPRSMLKAGYP